MDDIQIQIQGIGKSLDAQKSEHKELRDKVNQQNGLIQANKNKISDISSDLKTHIELSQERKLENDREHDRLHHDDSIISDRLDKISSNVNSLIWKIPATILAMTSTILAILKYFGVNI